MGSGAKQPLHFVLDGPNAPPSGGGSRGGGDRNGDTPVQIQGWLKDPPFSPTLGPWLGTVLCTQNTTVGTAVKQSSRRLLSTQRVRVQLREKVLHDNRSTAQIDTHATCTVKTTVQAHTPSTAAGAWGLKSLLRFDPFTGAGVRSVSISGAGVSSTSRMTAVGAGVVERSAIGVDFVTRVAVGAGVTNALLVSSTRAGA